MFKLPQSLDTCPFEVFELNLNITILLDKNVLIDIPLAFILVIGLFSSQ